MIVIGLTGGIGSGKSTVTQHLKELGAVIVDADKVGHETYLPETPAWKDLIATWGTDLLLPNREIDRKKLGAIVFSDPKNLQTLNGIVHPRLRELLLKKIEENRALGTKVLVIEAAILIEASWQNVVDEVWVAHAPEDVVIKRIMARNNWGEEQIRARIRSQMTNDERAKHANVMLDTNCTLEEVRAKVKHLWDERLTGKAKDHPR
ncbi:MAG: dephospho-CoA kinase [Chloroflexi bacterium]|nr:dephospho-CoA kinase [Chloroflexota bacterium]